MLRDIYPGSYGHLTEVSVISSMHETSLGGFDPWQLDDTHRTQATVQAAL